MNNLEKRKCSRCGIEKLYEEFHLNKAKPKGRRAECRVCTSNYGHEYRKRPKARKAKAIYSFQWRKNNPDRARKDRRARHKKYYNTLKGNLNSRISAAIRGALVNGKNGRHWESLVGYTIDQLKKHIEKNFLPGMNWENRNLWHIDHKIPILAFNFEKAEDLDFKRCWSLKNLQPLESKQNMIKNSRIDKPFQPSLAMEVVL